MALWVPPAGEWRVESPDIRRVGVLHADLRVCLAEDRPDPTRLSDVVLVTPAIVHYCISQFRLSRPIRLVLNAHVLAGGGMFPYPTSRQLCIHSSLGGRGDVPAEAVLGS